MTATASARRAVLVLLMQCVVGAALHAQSIRAFLPLPDGTFMGAGVKVEGADGPPFLGTFTDAWVESPLPSGLVGPSTALTAIGVGSNGDTYVGFFEKSRRRHTFGLLHRSGGTWRRLPALRVEWSAITSVVVAAPDRVYFVASGITAPYTPHLILWDGASYSPVTLPGNGTMSFAGIVSDTGGGLIVATESGGRGSVHRLENGEWRTLGAPVNGRPVRLASGSNGSLWLTDGGRNVWRWNGGAWQQPQGFPTSGATVRDVAPAADGAAYVLLATGTDREIVVRAQRDGLLHLDSLEYGTARSYANRIRGMWVGSDGQLLTAVANSPVSVSPDRFKRLVAVNVWAAATPARASTPAAAPLPTSYPDKDEKAAEVLAEMSRQVPEWNSLANETAGWFQRFDARFSASAAMELQRANRDDFRPWLDRAMARMDALGVRPMHNRLRDAYTELMNSTYRLTAALDDAAELRLSNSDAGQFRDRLNALQAAQRDLQNKNAALRAILPAYMERNGLK